MINVLLRGKADSTVVLLERAIVIRPYFVCRFILLSMRICNDSEKSNYL